MRRFHQLQSLKFKTFWTVFKGVKFFLMEVVRQLKKSVFLQPQI